MRRCRVLRCAASGSLTQAANPSALAETDGGFDYIRNTTLRQSLPGYSRRWRHYAGCLTNEATLAHKRTLEKPGELAKGSWFAVPQVGRFQRGFPHFHVITANHIVHPFWYPEFYPSGPGDQYEWLRFFTPHDPEVVLFTPASDGTESHRKFVTYPDFTYADTRRHLDIAVLHPRAHESGAMLKANFGHEDRDYDDPDAPGRPGSLGRVLGRDDVDEYEVDEMYDSDRQNYPFHFQLLSFDCRPLKDGELVSVHGGAFTDTVGLRPLMMPTVVRARVREAPRGAPGAGTFLFIEPESELSAGMCGGAVLRDGRVVGMLIASVSPTAQNFPGCGMVTPAASIREFLLGIEERWRWPEPPPRAWLQSRGLLTGPMASARGIAGADSPTDGMIPERYLPPKFLPQPTTSREIRDRIHTKFTRPLPADFVPPLLPGQERGLLPTSRDPTNPFGELDADSDMEVPTIGLFPGYQQPAEPGFAGYDDGAERSWWLIKYGSAENYLRAHGVDPKLLGTEEVQLFKNHYAPKPGERGWGLMYDSTDPDAPCMVAGDDDHKTLLEGGGSLPADAEPPRLSSKDMNALGMDHFFGEEEYVVHRDARRRRESSQIEAERREYLDRGEKVPESLERRMAHLIDREEGIAYHRGDKFYKSPELLRLEEADRAAALASGEVARLPEDEVVRLPTDEPEVVRVSTDEPEVVRVPTDEPDMAAVSSGVVVAETVGESGEVAEAEVETLQQSVDRRIEEAVRAARQRAGMQVVRNVPPLPDLQRPREVPVAARRDPETFTKEVPWSAPAVADYSARAAPGPSFVPAEDGAERAAAVQEPAPDTGEYDPLASVEIGDPLEGDYDLRSAEEVGLGERAAKAKERLRAAMERRQGRAEAAAEERPPERTPEEASAMLRRMADDPSVAPDVQHNLRRMSEGGDTEIVEDAMRRKLAGATDEQLAARQERLYRRVRPPKNAFEK